LASSEPNLYGFFIAVTGIGLGLLFTNATDVLQDRNTKRSGGPRRCKACGARITA
jgi:hypothetical protein